MAGNHELIVPHMTVSHDAGKGGLLRIELFAPHDGLPAELRISTYVGGRLLLILDADKIAGMCKP